MQLPYTSVIFSTPEIEYAASQVQGVLAVFITVILHLVFVFVLFVLLCLCRTSAQVSYDGGVVTPVLSG